MNKFSNHELSLILALYYFDKDKLNQKLVKDFTDKINIYFHKDVSPQNIVYAISIFKNIDPSFNVSESNVDEDYRKLWHAYIEKEKISELKKLYVSFKKGEYILDAEEIVSNDDADNELKEVINSEFEKYEFTFYEDKIKVPYKTELNYGKKSYRDSKVSYNALRLASFCCEFSKNHISFKRKKTNVMYTEAHHLIPLKYQKYFNVNLDVEANIVSLCSECHNRLHYGEYFIDILEKLYNERKERLKKCGIEITFEELLKMYA